MSFGLYFRNLRNSKQVTQKQIADAIGKSTMLVSGVETDKNGPFIEEDLQKISVFLDLSDNEKRKLYKEAAKTKGKLPPYLLDYLLKNDEAYRLLEILAQKKIGNESLSEIVELIKEKN